MAIRIGATTAAPSSFHILLIKFQIIDAAEVDDLDILHLHAQGV